MRKEGRQQVWASDLAKYVYCPEAARLDAKGVLQSHDALKRMAAGDQAHEAWQIREDAKRTPFIRALVVFAHIALVLLLIVAMAYLFWLFRLGGWS